MKEKDKKKCAREYRTVVESGSERRKNMWRQTRLYFRVAKGLERPQYSHDLRQSRTRQRPSVIPGGLDVGFENSCGGQMCCSGGQSLTKNEISCRT